MLTSRADYGGGPEHLYSLVRSLSSRIAVWVAAPAEEPYFIKYSGLVGLERMLSIPHRKFSLPSFWKLYKFVRKYDIDLTHSHGKGAGLYSRMLTMLTPTICIHTFHGLHIGKYGFIKRWLYLALEKLLSHWTASFIAVSPSERDQAIALGIAAPEKIVHIANGVQIPNLPNRAIPRPEIFNVITITRFDYAKNTELLILILQELNRRGELDRFRFNIIGSGESENHLKDLFWRQNLYSYVIFHGNSDRIREHLLEAFCYLSTSRWEGLSLSILEAMSCGLPVIATDVVGNRDLIIHRQDGFLYSLTDPAQATTLLVELADHPELWRRFSIAGREKIKQNYSLPRMTEQTEELYLSVVAGS